MCDAEVRRGVSAQATTTWEEALREIDIPFARTSVEVFRRRIEGSPQHGAFFSIYASSPIGRMRIAFKKKCLKVYTPDQSAEAEATLKERLLPIIRFTPWETKTRRTPASHSPSKRRSCSSTSSAPWAKRRDQILSGRPYESMPARKPAWVRPQRNRHERKAA